MPTRPSRRKGRRIAAALTGAVVLLTVATACTAQTTATIATQGPTSSASKPTQPTQDASGDPTPTATTGTASLILPLYAYEVTGIDDHTYNTAKDILVNKCMAKFGFSAAAIVSPFTQADAEVDSPSARAWGLTDLDVARKYGYHTNLTPAFVAQAKETAAQRKAAQEAAPTAEAEQEAEHRVLTGEDENGNPLKDASIPKGGCVGQATSQLPPRADNTLVTTLITTATQNALVDSRVVKVFAAWSTCMAAQGFHYKTPWDANNNPDWNPDAHPTPTAAEIATAVADVNCRQQNNVVPVWSGVEIDLENKEIDQNAQQLDSTQKTNEAAIAKAAQVVAQYGTTG